MKENKSKLSGLKKGDFVVIALVILISVLWFSLSFFQSSASLTAKISFDGKVVEEIDLSSLSNQKEVKVSDCVLIFERDGVYFEESDCKDKLCIKRGKLKRAGDSMACVPNRVVVSLHGKKNSNFHSITF